MELNEGAISPSAQSHPPASHSTASPPTASHRPANLALAGAAALWGLSFAVVKDAYADASPILFLAVRFALASALLPLFAWQGLVKTRPSRRTLQGGTLVGLVVGCGMVAQMLGLRYSTAANTGFLTSLYIVLVPFVGWAVYRSRISPQEWIAACLGTLGIALMSIDPRTLQVAAGDWFTIFSALLFSFQVVLVKRFSEEGQSAWIAFLQIFGTFAVAALAVASGIEALAWQNSPRLWLALGFLVIGATVVAFLLQSWGQRYTSATRAALIFGTEPLFAAIASTLWLGETWNERKLLGAALILVAVAAAEVKLKPRPQTEHISN